MKHDPRLPRMPDRPTLFDFFRFRFGPATHLLQSARLAQKNGVTEKLVLACLIHDIGNIGFIRADHGYWAAQLIEPYVDEEVAFAVRYHQVLRFFADESVGYTYPQSYVRLFGADFRPEPYVEREYQYARNHKYYMSARLLTVNDLYAFDPDLDVELEEFTDIVGRHFRQPEEGLGFDHSPPRTCGARSTGRRATSDPPGINRLFEPPLIAGERRTSRTGCRRARTLVEF